MTVAGLTRLWPRLGRVLRCLAAGAIVLTFGWSGVTDADTVEQTDRHSVRVRILTRGLEHPWSLAFLPDGRMLVTERAGRLRYVAADGTLDPTPISGLPESLSARRQGGLHDVALHPRFSQNRLVYFAYAGKGTGGYGTELARGRLDGHRLTGVEVLFRALPKSWGGRHFGGRVVFDGTGHVFLTLGDRGDGPRAQDPGDHAGSIIRLTEDGGIPQGQSLPIGGRCETRDLHPWQPQRAGRGDESVDRRALDPRARPAGW